MATKKRKRAPKAKLKAPQYPKPEITVKLDAKEAVAALKQAKEELVALGDTMLDSALPDLWLREVAEAAKIVGEPVEKVISRLIGTLPERFRSHIVIAEFVASKIASEAADTAKMEAEINAKGIEDRKAERLQTAAAEYGRMTAEINERRKMFDPTLVRGLREFSVEFNDHPFIRASGILR